MQFCVEDSDQLQYSNGWFMKNLAWAKVAIYDKKELYVTIYEWIKLVRANLSVKTAIEFKMDVIFAPNLNLSLFPHYWWEFGKTRKQE